MAEQILKTLASKRQEIEAHIGHLERDLEQARRDLSALLATTVVFSGDGPLPKSYMNLSKVFPRHELPMLCQKLLNQAAMDGARHPVSTRQIAAYVIQQKGMDGQDRHLRKAVAYKVVQIMRRWERQRTVQRLGKVQGVVVWTHV